MALLAACLALPASAAITINSPGVYLTVDNCGFTPTGPTAGWVRAYLLSDSLAGPGTDFWVNPGEVYKLRLKQVQLFAQSNPSPTGLVIDDSAACGYTSSQGLDECGGYNLTAIVPGGIAPNQGFFAGGPQPGDIGVFLEYNEDRLQIARMHPGEFFSGSIVDCMLVDGSQLTYIAAVGGFTP